MSQQHGKHVVDINKTAGNRQPQYVQYDVIFSSGHFI